MKLLQPVFLFLTLGVVALAHAQSGDPLAELQSARVLSSNAHTRSIATDDSGNVYHLVWTFSELTHLGGGAPLEFGTDGQIVMHILKYDADMALQWVMPLTQLGQGNVLHAMELGALDVDGAGHIYVGGSLALPTDFNPFGEAVEVDVLNPQFSNAFVAKYSPEGILDWVKTYAAEQGHAEITALHRGADGGLFAGLRFDGDVSGTGFQIDRLTNFGTDAALLALAEEGDYLWHHRPEAAFQQGITVISTHGSGSIAYGGYAQRDNLGGGQLRAGVLDVAGSLIWDKQLVQNTGSPLIEFPVIAAIAMGPEGSVYFGGEFYGLAAFNVAGALTLEEGTLSNFTDGFVAKYGLLSGDFQWAQVLRSPAYKSYVDGITVDDAQVKVVGHYQLALEVGSGEDVVSLETENGEMYLASFEPATGDVIAAGRLDLSENSAMQVAHFFGENGLLAGASTWAGFDHGEISISGNAHFLALYQIDEALSSEQWEMEIGNVVVYPNPSHGEIRVNGLPEGVARMALYDMSGRMVKRINAVYTRSPIDLGTLPAGLYLLQVWGEGWQTQGKVVVR